MVKKVIMANDVISIKSVFNTQMSECAQLTETFVQYVPMHFIS